MKIIAFIEQKEIIEKILRHLSLWDTRNHDPPSENAGHNIELTYDDSDSQIPPYDDWI